MIILLRVIKMLKIKAKCSQFILFLSLFQMNCIMFTVSDLDPDGLLSQLLLLSRLQNSSLATEPILTRSLYGYANGTKAFFQWHKVPDATSYKLYYSTSETVSLSDSSSPETTEPWILLDGLDTSTLYYFQLYATLSDGNQVTHKQSYPAFTNPVPFGTSSSASALNISASQGIDSGLYGVLNINPYLEKIHVSTQNGNTPGGKIPSLFNCNSDGTNCSFQNVSTGIASVGDQVTPHSIIDFQSEKIFISSTNQGSSSEPALFLCPIDGGNCTYQDISVGQGSNSGFEPFLIINPLNGELLTLTRNASVGLNLFRCDNLGTVCQSIDLSGSNQYMPATNERAGAVINPDNNKLYTVIPSFPTNGAPRLYISNLDGTNVSSIDISSGSGSGSGTAPTVLIDYINSKLIVITNGFNARVGFFRCDLDGSNSTYTPLGTNGQGTYPSATLDLINQKVLIYAGDNTAPSNLLLFRCALDGTGCNTPSLNLSSIVSLTGIGVRTTTRIDPKSGRVLVSSQRSTGTPTGLPYLIIH